MSAGSFRLLPGCRILFDNEYAEKATAEYLAEILHKVVAGNALVTTALPLIEVHSINATDAIILRSALNLAA